MPTEKPSIEGSRQLLINLHDELHHPDQLKTLKDLGDLVWQLNDHFHLFLRDYLLLKWEADRD
jgi:hypothetical protein